ncbi:uncharacterized protein EDB93DRAFT_1105473 [Suillus bovinus]|uniref:uncharacterized protein n=1 Tax=Suillus bovinus TaxID=48563 RepID=UPI001B886E2E|nr:uncharacterized protein EDB93DRAFT_1105473 [Suillus bovinus]KAG2142214.1 hypothetical protein EDB93DRAFT_1105473 [Suillus bovinus]
MVPRINSDTEEAPAPRPKRVAVPSAKVISADNAADQELLSHRIAHIANRAAVILDPTDLDGANNDKIQLDENRLHKVLMPRMSTLHSLLLLTRTTWKKETPRCQ